MAQSNDESPELSPIKSDLDTATHLGQRVAEIARQVRSGLNGRLFKENEKNEAALPRLPQPGASLEKYAPHIRDEVRHSWELYKSGAVRDIYFRQDRPGVAIIAECASVEEAREALAQFPLAKVGLIDWEIIPLGPFVNREILFAPVDPA